VSSGIVAGNVQAMVVVSITVDAANMTDTASTTEETITVPGVRVGDKVFLSKRGHLDGITNANARVSAADTVSLAWVNPTGAAKNQGAFTFDFLIVRTDGDTASFVF